MAAAIDGFVEALPSTDADANVVFLGNLNEFQFYTPLEILTNGSDASAELTNLASLLTDQTNVYSFNFEGNSQLLDHILASSGLMARNPLFEIVHVDTSLQYAGLSGSAIDVSRIAASDHDMLLVSFLIAAASANVPVAPAWLLLALGRVALNRSRRRD